MRDATPEGDEHGRSDDSDGAGDVRSGDGSIETSSDTPSGQSSFPAFLGGDGRRTTINDEADGDASAARDAPPVTDNTASERAGDRETPDGNEDGSAADTDGAVGSDAGVDGATSDASPPESRSDPTTAPAGETFSGSTSQEIPSDDACEGDPDTGTTSAPEQANAGDDSSGETSAAMVPAPAPQPAEPAHGDSLDDDREALDADHDAAHEEAARATPDEAALARDLDEIAAALEEFADSCEIDESADGESPGRQGASPGRLDSLSILPAVGEQAPPARWQEAIQGADAVGGTLRIALRERRRDQIRSGVTSGSFDRRRVGALARGDVNVFSVSHPGEEKQYDLVLVLDRSSSMRSLIDTAENAVARFALACEDLGINVTLLDFIHGQARLIKPFSVDTEHVQASLMNGKTGGGTPLADALGLARSLLEQRRDAPLIIIITDGKPGAPDAYQAELQQCVSPVCGLTLALDTPRGDVPSRAANVERFYDRHLYVHDASQLDARLDQFAVMFDGL